MSGANEEQTGGFDEAWLALREPADHAARDPALLQAVSARFAGRQAIVVVDLGCGSGSNLRGLAPHLPPRQSWRLVDRDAALLRAARRRLISWADSGADDGDTLHLRKGTRFIEVRFSQADLTADMAKTVAGTPDLVTAAALFDLVSAAWMKRFAATLAAAAIPLYAVLTYDGRTHWSPPHPLDEAVNAAFHAHQRSDKGFGRAAGPDAAAALGAAFADAGYGVAAGDSPWRLGPDQQALLVANARGIAAAVAETGMVDRSALAEWLSTRLAGGSCLIGHTDLFATPR